MDYLTIIFFYLLQEKKTSTKRGRKAAEDK